MAKNYETVQKKFGNPTSDFGNFNSKDTSGRFATDALLRKYGFEIHSRPLSGKPIWTRKGTLFSEGRALLEIADTEVADAEYAEFLYEQDAYGS